MFFEEVDGGSGSGASISIGICLKCKWPLHNDSCAKEHDQLECAVLTRRQVHPQGSQLDYSKLALLRAVLLKRRNPEAFAELLRMPYPVRHSPDMSIIAEVTNFVLRDCGLRDDVDPLTLQRLVAICFANTLRINYSAHKMTSRFAYVLFRGVQGRILPHSCIPTCRVDFDPVTFNATVRTLKEVAVGEALTLNYTSPPERAFTDRIMELASMSVLHKCRRCSSPNEMGTHFSSIVCPAPDCSPSRRGGVRSYLVPFFDNNKWK